MKKMRTMLFVLLLLAVGCKSNEGVSLTGHEWKLQSMTQEGVAVTNPQELPTILFSDSSAVYGFAGCNRFFGSYTVGDKGEMTVKPGGSTMMFCPDMQFEDVYLKALNEVRNYAINGKELTLTDADGKLSIVYMLPDTTQLVGDANDSHDCNAAAGYTWSAVRENCIRLFEDGIRMNSATDTTATSSAFIVFAADSLKAEVFLPADDIHPVLDRRTLPEGGYAWNQEDDDTLNVRLADGRWIIEQRGNLIYSQAE